MPKGKARQQGEVIDLARWLALEFQDRNERSLYPELRSFLAWLLAYPPERIRTEDTAGSGFADALLYTDQAYPWVAVEFKLQDEYITQEARNRELWEEKRKYLSGSIQYLLLITPKYMQLRDATGRVVHDGTYISLQHVPLEVLREKLSPISAEKANHASLWETFIRGQLPYSYLPLSGEGAGYQEQLRKDLATSFEELFNAAQEALNRLEEEYRDYKARLSQIESLRSVGQDVYIRARSHLEAAYPSTLKHLFENHLPRFAEQFGRDVDTALDEWGVVKDPVIKEAFLADSVAAMIAKVLFIRFLEDLSLTDKPHRRLTNGGLKSWGEFMSVLAGNAKALLKVAAMDLREAYPEPFAEEAFSWVLETNGKLDYALQRLLLRVNAYDFSGLSEDVLGDIYQNFLPPKKRKRLGEFYTPKEVVDYILKETALSMDGDYPRLLDPACGSGTFLVRYLHHLEQDARRRGVDIDVQQVAEAIWGFDINPFASYVSAFQVLWGLLRLAKGSSEAPPVHVYTLNSLLDDTDVRHQVPDLPDNPGELARDEGEWDCVVGNPPYIRAERAKHGERLRALYDHIWGTNIDTGILFLWRAMRGSAGGAERGWVKEGGRLGMVVSGGYASNEAAAPVWNLLVPGNSKAWSLRKLVWLEFVPKIWGANVIPMILILEKTPPKPEHRVEIWVPQAWPKEKPDVGEQASIAYKDFFDPQVNPWVESAKGPSLLPLLKEEDIPLLRKLYPGNGFTVCLNEAMETQYSRNRKPQPYWWTYGIKRNGAPVTSDPEGKRPVPVLKADQLAVAYAGGISGYIDLDDERLEYPSIWESGRKFTDYLAVAEIARAPFGVLVRASGKPEGGPYALNQVVVGIPEKGCGEAIAAYLNSSLVRWYYLVRLRSGVLEGSCRAHIYPRTLQAFPWPKDPDEGLLRKLSDLYQELEETARRTRDNPQAWLRMRLDDAQEQGSGTLLRARRFGIDFSTWSGEIPWQEVRLEGDKLTSQNLFADLDLKDPDLARFVYLLLKLEASAREEKGPFEIDKTLLQRLFIPDDYKNILEEYEMRNQAFASVREKFFRILEEINDAVFDLFRLDEAEREYIRKRLAEFPLSKLVPRYPWEVSEASRGVQSYQEDRFR